MKKRNLFSIRGIRFPKNYKSHLDVKETEAAIKFAKDCFQQNLAKQLNLSRVSAPVAVASGTGINDNLNGVEKPVCFKVKDAKTNVEVVQSLAKWKRKALADYNFKHGEGLYTDMNALRPDERLDCFHSIYVDQWDWEKIVKRSQRNVKFLKTIVKKIYNAVKNTEVATCKKYKKLPRPFLPTKIHFIHSEELERLYPSLKPSEREDAICREKGAVFVIGIGADLKNGKPHDGRAPDYDDWITRTSKTTRGLNGDILVWYPHLNCAMELSSMGIRVDKKSLLEQLEIRKEMRRVKLPFHKELISGKLPLTMGGGIGQSRISMLFLRKVHIGEVQSAIWPAKVFKACENKNIFLL